MPDLKTTLHVDMLNRYRRRRASLVARVVRAVAKELKGEVYGLAWGDPETVESLRFIRDRYVLPYVKAEHSALEIGPGGGRWTRYLLGFGRLYVVDYYAEVIDELRRNYNKPHMEFIKNNGTDFPAVGDQSIDYLFSFGAFVHLDVPLIEGYLTNMRRVLKPGGNAVIHYSDKTKIMAQLNTSFSENTPETMRSMVSAAGFVILEEDVTSMWHSSVIRFTH